MWTRFSLFFLGVLYSGLIFGNRQDVDLHSRDAGSSGFAPKIPNDRSGPRWCTPMPVPSRRRPDGEPRCEPRCIAGQFSAQCTADIRCLG